MIEFMVVLWLLGFFDWECVCEECHECIDSLEEY